MEYPILAHHLVSLQISVLDMDLVKKEASQELRKLPVTSYLESQVWMSVLSRPVPSREEVGGCTQGSWRLSDLI